MSRRQIQEIEGLYDDHSLKRGGTIFLLNLKFKFVNGLLETHYEETTNYFDCGMPDHGHSLCTKQFEICQHPFGN